MLEDSEHCSKELLGVCIFYVYDCIDPFIMKHIMFVYFLSVGLIGSHFWQLSTGWDLNSQPMACRTGAEAIWVTPFFLVQYIYSTMTEHLRSRDG